ncbi:MAG: HAMP domain-containing protein [Candidatus Abyssobacteria bacterium SURF_5]|uniref:histidine kinase n=1 Tax=Abyssobacteria bacterium (strain SURF_5) TaxID=2093360 RepID=A0A3A4NVV3_ABYX5|nr:MAG: HAMP domain-containing protein [Candidatus Abyssubacteria bacterium SURF_5]
MSLVTKLFSVSNSLAVKLIVCVVGSVVLIFGVFGYINVQNSRRHLEGLVLTSAQGVGDIVKRSTRLSMLRNGRDELYHMIKQIGNEPGIRRIRILNKEGKITFSTDENEVNTFVDKKAEACYACHTYEQPLVKLSRPDRARIFRENGGERLLGLIQPIENEPDCYTAPCHVHSETKKVLGVFDINLSLAKVDENISQYQRNIALNLLVVMIAVSGVSAGFVWLMIYGPVKKLIMGTKRIAMGDMDYVIETKSVDELGLLALSFNKMTRDLKKAQDEITEWTKTLEDRVAMKTNELQKANDLILQAEKLASIGRLAAIVAHELNNPLAGIVAYSKLLLKRMDNNTFSESSYAKSREIITMMMREALRCGDIVKNLLQFSRQSDLMFASEDICVIIRESVRLVEHLVTIRNIELQFELSEGIPAVSCDSQKIKQVLLALLINACDAVAEDGVVRVGCRWLAAVKAVEISVQDNGIGMEEETLRHIFEPFFTTKEEGNGVGLGLAVAHSIVERHGGAISVKSVVNEGTEFKITLPIAPAHKNEHSIVGTEDAAGFGEGDLLP